LGRRALPRKRADALQLLHERWAMGAEYVDIEFAASRARRGWRRRTGSA
jgi:hypothetical protein